MAGTYQPVHPGQDHIADDDELADFDIPLTARSNVTTHHENPSAASIRPAAYYGDGPFDPPSSDDEDDTLLEKNLIMTPGMAENGTLGPRERGGLVIGGGKRPRPTSLKVLVISLIGLVSLAAVIGIFAARAYSGSSSYHPPGVRKISMDHIFNGTFAVASKQLNWVPEAGDGVFSIEENGFIKLIDLKTNSSRSLLSTSEVKNEDGNAFGWSEWTLSADMKYMLVKGDYVKQWRWSSFGNYYIHDLTTKKTIPLTAPSHPPTTKYAVWSPTGQSITFVKGNDLYVLSSPGAQPIRVTNTGNFTVSHGVPPWVYEEEVFSAESTLWFSPDSSKVAFVSFDETDVPEYSFPVYNPTNDANTVVPFPTDKRMKYPKPGSPNPLATIRVFDIAGYIASSTGSASSISGSAQDHQKVEDAKIVLEWEGMMDKTNQVLTEVKWLGDMTLIVKEVNRNADTGHVILFELDDQAKAQAVGNGGIVRGQVVRRLGKDGEEGDDGWIDSFQNIYALPSGGYIDIVPTKDGYNHIAMFRPANTSTPRFLTSGSWEVTDGITAVDPEKGIAYFRATNPSSVERQIFSLQIPDVDSTATEISAPTALTDTQTQAYWHAKFSPGAGFYLLTYEGPGVPYQKVIKVDDADFHYTLEENSRLQNATEEYEAPVISHSTIVSDGYELNVKEVRPPRMDDSGRTKYPVLFYLYGGPASQLVDLKFGRGWEHYLACGLQYVIVIVDGRGTGYKGRKLRNVVKGNLGFFETQDQINAARIWAAKDYVDPKRIGIWGWSFGGFMSSKVVEADAGIHSLAMSVAPVVSWRMYDSIYTERYMNLPDLNPGGYINASISNVTGFSKVDYLLAHGSGDDNVHYANSAHMLDMLTQAKVRNFRFRMFTDSDHSISTRGAQREIFEYMTGFLEEKWGRGGRRRNW